MAKLTRLEMIAIQAAAKKLYKKNKKRRYCDCVKEAGLEYVRENR